MMPKLPRNDGLSTLNRLPWYVPFFVKATPLTVGRLPFIRIFRHTQQKVSSSASTRPSSDETLQRSKLAKKHYPPLPVHLLQ